MTVVAASRSATRLIETDTTALDVIADTFGDATGEATGDVTRGPGSGAGRFGAVAEADGPDELVRLKRLAQLRITTRDLLGVATLGQTTTDLSDLAAAVLAAAVRMATADADAGGIAVIGMGKLGGRELNYASDIDVMFVDGDPRTARTVMDVARRCYRVDANLRPEGRDGALTRTVDAYRAYWERWAQPWEFQALLKAVPVAGDAEVGSAWAEAAATSLWGHGLSSDDLRSLRALKARSETEVERHGAAERDVKRGPGGIRDIEFAVQLLQLVHGRADPDLRSPNTIVALTEMDEAGYVAHDDAEGLVGAYRFLRRVEHVLQIEDEQQVHTVPEDREHRRRVARVLGYRGRPEAGPTEAFDRELARGGQLFFLHNDVESIGRMQRQLQELAPDARIGVAHGQMPERELERVMLDFQKQRFNVLLASTIIESGIDIPNANTIIINRADKFGLAQLHQLRGRVGRSHHRAYAYLVIPDKRSITADARKRLDAIASMDELGAGFTLATHDLEIRGAGELLGEDQSGQMAEVGFSLYTELLERAVRSIKRGELPDVDGTAARGAEVEMHAPALIPEDYLPDVHTRLTLYKRISSARDAAALRELQVEMIDRFGLLPDPAKLLFATAELKLEATALGIAKIDIGTSGGRVKFVEKPLVDPMAIIRLVQGQPKQYRMDGPDTLRLTLELPTAAERVQAARGLVALLAPSGR